VKSRVFTNYPNLPVKETELAPPEKMIRQRSLEEEDISSLLVNLQRDNQLGLLDQQNL
jgi:hypothetical protein